MSNLIKSGKVVDLDVPVNVGVSYTFSSLTNTITQNVVTAKPEDIKPKEEMQKKESIKDNIPEISKEDIINQYMEEAKKKAEEYYQTEIKRAYEEGIKNAAR